MQIIKDKAICEDHWLSFDGVGAVPDGDIIVPLAVWQTETFQAQDLSGRRLGVLLPSDATAEDVRDDLSRLDLIAIDFPTFNDGRGYSIAKILRDRLGYEKEIRAVGDVLRDQIFYMQRCGFNAYALKEGRSITDALTAFDDFSVTYQVSADEKKPLYRRS